MAVEGLGGGSPGIAFLVSAGVVYEIMAAACSSPQTTELNADRRADTLMKWVHIGIAQSVLFVGASIVIEKQYTKPILIGAGLAMGIQYACYIYAKNSGLASGEPGTEKY
jgi:hypothetical protein